MRYMLDTNICSYILKNHPTAVKQKFEEVGAGNICISAIVLAELYYGAARHPKGIVIRREIDNFVSRLVVIPWDENAADHYGVIRASLEKAGTLVRCHGYVDSVPRQELRRDTCNQQPERV